MKRFFLGCLAALVTPFLLTAAAPRSVTLVIDENAGAPARHGIRQFEAALSDAGCAIRNVTSGGGGLDGTIILAGTTASNGAAARALRDANVTVPAAAESLVVKKLTIGGRPALVACGADDRGLMYALLELAEQVRAAPPAEDDSLAFIREVASPAYRQSGYRTYVVQETVYGGSSNQVAVLTRFDRFADLDGPSPLRQHLGEQGYEQYLAKRPVGAVADIERSLWRLRPELSITQPAKSKPTE